MRKLLLFCESNERIKFRTVSNIGTLNTTNGKFDYRDAFVEFKIVNFNAIYRQRNVPFTNIIYLSLKTTPKVS